MSAILFKELNDIEEVIRSVGDQDGQRTRAKCYRTRWDLHEVSAEVNKIGTASIKIAHRNPLAGRTSPDGSPEEIRINKRVIKAYLGKS